MVFHDAGPNEVGDGKLTSADAQWSSFTVIVTNANGTREAKTLTELGVTKINLKPCPTHIELPDGSLITGQSTFLRGRITRAVANLRRKRDRGRSFRLFNPYFCV